MDLLPYFTDEEVARLEEKLKTEVSLKNELIYRDNKDNKYYINNLKGLLASNSKSSEEVKTKKKKFSWFNNK